MSPNRLAQEKSLYLRQHAENPVDWYPWGEEAIQKAREEKKPILLSIGYSSCHWCHVMEKESFNDPRIAKLINENFVPIKVDREERPDIDEVYMRAVQLMTGTGGWPLTVFLTPDLKPFFGGTYFPPRRRAGIPSFEEILRNIAETWRRNREGILRSAEEHGKIVKTLYLQRPAETELTPTPINVAYEILVSFYDEVYGGFGGAPKFPMPTYLSFLHMYAFREGERAALKMSLETLEKMARGGIFDQLAGGFHRYSTDRSWLIPHFEKMLYDNALLATAYLEAYQLSRKPLMLETAVKTLDWMLGEMQSPEGGFYSSVDADTSEGEGVFYTWTRDEVVSLLGDELGEAVCWLYAITSVGNFERGRTVLTRPRDPEDVAARYGIALERLEEARERLLNARMERPNPSIDEKVIASWNGLAISAMCKGYQVTGRRKYLEAAEKAAALILGRMWSGGRLRRVCYGGQPMYEGALEDYAFLVQGLLDLFETVFQPSLLRSAVELSEAMIELFWDGEDGGFYFSVEEVGGISRVKYGYDGVMPSGNSVAALNLVRLYELTGEGRYLEYVEKTLKAFSGGFMDNPADYTTLMKALAFYLGPRTEVVLVDGGGGVDGMLRLIYETYHPLRTVLAITPENRAGISTLSPLAIGKEPVDGRPTAYLCENYTCRYPVTTVEELEKLLERRV
ncbi:hypothetical protein HRbin01_01354 [archaeon HR01]|nr:hypothetical protein HRbin01_01354 [archaeon HR01]